MPKATKPSKPSVPKIAPRTARVSGPVANKKSKLKVEDTELELSGFSGPSVPAYQLTQPVHFDELNSLWPADARIPSVTSRRAWAVARNLNPANIHSWWYRRRKVAKKLRIKIPEESYELEVGCPPVIPVKEEEMSEEEQVASKPTVSPKTFSGTAIDCVSDTLDPGEPSTGRNPMENDTPIETARVSPSSEAHIFTSCAETSHLSGLDSSGTTVVDELEHGTQSVSKSDKFSAYKRPSSPTSPQVSSPSPSRLLYSHFASESSSLPPSSPPAKSCSPIPALFPVESPLDEFKPVEDDLLPTLPAVNIQDCASLTATQARNDRDTLWASFAVLESAGYPAHLLPLTSYQTHVPLSSCASTPILDIQMLTTNNNDNGHSYVYNKNENESEPGSSSIVPAPFKADSLLPSNAEFNTDPVFNSELALCDFNSYDAPWCLDGFRISCDGSLVGLCSCCYCY